MAGSFLRSCITLSFEQTLCFQGCMIFDNLAYSNTNTSSVFISVCVLCVWVTRDNTLHNARPLTVSLLDCHILIYMVYILGC